MLIILVYKLINFTLNYCDELGVGIKFDTEVRDSVSCVS